MSIPGLMKEIADNIKALPDQTQIAIGIASNGNSNFYGMIRENGAIRQIDNAGFAFEIGSVTKSLTGNVLAQLIINKKVHPDDAIRQFLPFTLLNDPSITLKQLALHTAGVPRLPGDFETQPGYHKNNLSLK